MKKIFTVALGLIMASAMTMAFAQGKAPAFNSAPEQLMSLEYNWSQALVTKDIRAIGPILADDYVALGPAGESQNKAEVLGDLRYGVVEYSAIHTNPMTVRFFGDTAILVGSDEETSSRMGADTSGHYDWTDVFVLRNGHWQVVASQETFLPADPNFVMPVVD